MFNGETIDDVYMENTYLKNISRDGRATRWMASYLIPDVYGKLTTGEKNVGQKPVRSPTSWQVWRPEL